MANGKQAEGAKIGSRPLAAPDYKNIWTGNLNRIQSKSAEQISLKAVAFS